MIENPAALSRRIRAGDVPLRFAGATIGVASSVAGKRPYSQLKSKRYSHAGQFSVKPQMPRRLLEKSTTSPTDNHPAACGATPHPRRRASVQTGSIVCGLIGSILVT